MHSEYMEWAKTCSTARFNLATSGVTSVPLAEFPLRLPDLELTSPGGYGYEPLQQRIAHHTGAPEECVVAATGTSMANHLAMAAVLAAGDEVLIEQPAYGPILDVANFLGARVKRFTRRFATEFAIDAAEIGRAMTQKTRLIVLTNLHNPSGALVPAETLAEIGEIAARADAKVLVDEVYLEMLFEGSWPAAFEIGQQFGGENPFLVTNSLTKTYGLSGLRCGWVLASPELARRIWRLNDLFGVNAAHPAERIAVMAFDHLQQFLARTRTLLRRNWALLDAFLDSRSDIECFRPLAGTAIFPRLRRGDADAFVQLLRDKYETSVVPGRFFEAPQHFRIGIGGETATLSAGLERLSDALDEFARR